MDQPDLPIRRGSECRQLPRALGMFSAVLVALTVISLVAAEFKWVIDRDWQGFSVLWPAGAGFDFYDYLERMRSLRQPNFFALPGYPWYYPAPGALAYGLFYAVCRGGDWRPGYVLYALVVLVAGLGAAFRLSGAMEARALSRKTARNFVFSTLLLSWPIFLSLQRGNLESVFWFVLALAILMVRKEHWRTAGVLLGLAAAFKIYPAFCFALFLRKRRWKEVVIGLAVMGIVTLLALRYMEADVIFAAKNVSAGVRAWTKLYAVGSRGGQMIYDHALFELVKLFLPPGQRYMLTVYGLIVGTLATVLFFGRVMWMPLTNQVLFLVVASVFLPPASFDYTLQNLYIPWTWIVLGLLEGDGERGRRWPALVMVLFAIEFAPVSFITWYGFSVGGVIKGVALLALLVVTVSVRMPSEWGEQQTSLA